MENQSQTEPMTLGEFEEFVKDKNQFEIVLYFLKQHPEAHYNVLSNYGGKPINIIEMFKGLCIEAEKTVNVAHEQWKRLFPNSYDLPRGLPMAQTLLLLFLIPKWAVFLRLPTLKKVLKEQFERYPQSMKHMTGKESADEL